MAEIELAGCRAEPLASYLKALGVFRLVGEQADPSVRGCWRGDHFLLSGSLDRDALLDFFLDRYMPAPLVAPWNGSSGFYPKDRQRGIATIEASTSDRLRTYRVAIAQAREIVADPLWNELLQKKNKKQLVEWCRSTLPDEAVTWIDAVVVLTADSQAYPPLLGTGGNDGHLEFSNTFMQRVVDVLGIDDTNAERARDRSRAWLVGALFADGAVKLLRESIGMFDPGAAGGSNSAPTGDADSLVNPWDFVLLLEGALLFASSAARRLSAETRGRTSIPFTVAATPIGYSSNATEENSRGEIWAPIWTKLAGLAETQRLVGEGRAEWRGTQARDGLDFVRAVSSLAVDRGIDAFVRYTMVERRGKSYAAVPEGRVQVVGRREVAPLAALDPWLQRIRRLAVTPAAVKSGLRAVDAAIYETAVAGGSTNLLRVLQAAAVLELSIGRSPSLRDAVHQPITDLRAASWMPLVDDGTAEFRVAAALAAQGDGRPPGLAGSDHTSRLAFFLRPVVGGRGGRAEWSADGVRVPGLGDRRLSSVLADVLVRRALDRARSMDGVPESAGQRGITLHFTYRRPALLSNLVDFARGVLDDSRVEEILGALLLLDGWSEVERPSVDVDRERSRRAVPPALALLAPFFNPGESPNGLVSGAEWAPLLHSGRVVDVVEDALRRMRVARFRPLLTAPRVVANSVPPDRLAMAVLVPISARDIRSLLDRVSTRDVVLPEVEPETSEAQE